MSTDCPAHLLWMLFRIGFVDFMSQLLFLAFVHFYKRKREKEINHAFDWG
jgi:hypothetical protein